MDMHGVSIRDMAGLSSELNARFVHKMDIVTSHLAKPLQWSVCHCFHDNAPVHFIPSK